MCRHCISFLFWGRLKMEWSGVQEVTPAQWERLLDARRRKMAQEEEVQRLTNIMNSMGGFLAELTDADESNRKQIEASLRALAGSRNHFIQPPPTPFKNCFPENPPEMSTFNVLCSMALPCLVHIYLLCKWRQQSNKISKYSSVPLNLAIYGSRNQGDYAWKMQDKLNPITCKYFSLVHECSLTCVWPWKLLRSDLPLFCGV